MTLVCTLCATPIPSDSPVCVACGSPVPDVTALADATPVDNRLKELLQAETAGEYVIEHELGRGGMGAVYLAVEPALTRRVAIKVLPPQLTFASPALVERFMREARAAATLIHPHIIPIHRVSRGESLVWYAMQYVEGESLDRVLQRERQLGLERTVGIVTQVADALDHAHHKGIVHRDIKPGNVMVDAWDRVMVTDFGIAKDLEGESITSGDTVGTPRYMSPEQCEGAPVTGAADQYALGVMTYQMLAGRLPFSGDSVAGIIKKHVMEPPPPLAEHCPTLPIGVPRVIERALAKSPRHRFPSTAAFASALSQAAKGLDDATAWSDRTTPWDAKTQPIRPYRRWLGRRAALVYRAVAGTALGLALVLRPGPGRDGAAAGSDAGDRADGAPGAGAPPITPLPSVGIGAGGTISTIKSEGISAGDRNRLPSGKPGAALAAPAPATRSDSGMLSLVTNPPSVVYINGHNAGHPVYRRRVSPGEVRLRFVVSDTIGAWSADTVVVVKPRQEKLLGTLQLQRSR